MLWMNPNQYGESTEETLTAERANLTLSALAGGHYFAAGGFHTLVALDGLGQLWRRAFGPAETPASDTQHTEPAARTPNTAGALVRRWIRYWQARRILGAEKSLPLPLVDSLLDEVARYRWIEAQKAGFDVWAVGYPEDPERGAMAEWLRKHYDGWYRAQHRALTA
ncbi:MAG: hypothetical protein RLY93_20245 [Sumerlaeia bacterium]